MNAYFFKTLFAYAGSKKCLLALNVNSKLVYNYSLSDVFQEATAYPEKQHDDFNDHGFKARTVLRDGKTSGP